MGGIRVVWWCGGVFSVSSYSHNLKIGFYFIFIFFISNIFYCYDWEDHFQVPDMRSLLTHKKCFFVDREWNMR